jgi:hypothetical protein
VEQLVCLSPSSHSTTTDGSGKHLSHDCLSTSTWCLSFVPMSSYYLQNMSVSVALHVECDVNCISSSCVTS